MFELRKVDVLSLAKISAVFGVIIGFIFGLIFTITFLAIPQDLLIGTTTGFPFTGFFGVFAIIGFPIIYGIGGFIFGAIYAIIYNFVAGKVGGVAVDLVGMGAGNIRQKRAK